jgi:hypothetical protein
MTTIKLLSAGVIAAAMLTTPVMARNNYLAERHIAGEANTRTAPIPRYIDGRGTRPTTRRVPKVPRVGALPAPPDGENCDVGDNPSIC